MFPTDFSEYSDTALQLAIDLARQQKAKINLLHVLRFRDMNDELHMMQKQIARFPEAKDIEIIPNIRKGKIYEEILNAEAEKKRISSSCRGTGKGILCFPFCEA